MISARQMFHLLNYDLIEETDQKIVYAHRHARHFIEFSGVGMFKRVRSYSIQKILFDDEIKLPLHITYSELEAINQQMKELGGMNELKNGLQSKKGC